MVTGQVIQTATTPVTRILGIRPRDHRSKEEYQKADRSYNEVWGPLEDYRDGYQQGFEAGYTAGYDRQPFNSSIPTGLSRRGNTADSKPADDRHPTEENTSKTLTRTNGSTTPRRFPVHQCSGADLDSRNAMMVIELESSLSTDATQRGDRFQARVIEPGEYQGAIIDGRVTRVKRPGKVKGVAELQLSFEQYPDAGWPSE